MKKSKLNAIKLRSLLIVIIFLMMIGSTAGVYFAQDFLIKHAKTVSQSVANSTSSGQNVQSLKKLQTELESYQSVMTKANNIQVPISNYQSRVIPDINNYATASNIKVKLSFSATALPAGSKTAPITITLESQPQYTDLLKFLKLIETNLPKMQVSSINLTRDNTSQTVKSDQIIIDVYTK